MPYSSIGMLTALCACVCVVVRVAPGVFAVRALLPAGTMMLMAAGREAKLNDMKVKPARQRMAHPMSLPSLTQPAGPTDAAAGASGPSTAKAGGSSAGAALPWHGHQPPSSSSGGMSHRLSGSSVYERGTWD